jgi:hypothetical protein
MLSVVIPTHESERALVRTLVSLVPGSTAGIVSEVILADAGSTDETQAVGDIAGCIFLSLPGPQGARLKSAAETARRDWLMFVTPGAVLDPGWVGEVEHFLAIGEGEAATFSRSRGEPHPSALVEAARLVASSFKRGRPEQGLIVARRLYQSLGGHRADAAAPEADLLRRLGRRAVPLRSSLRLLDSVK